MKDLTAQLQSIMQSVKPIARKHMFIATLLVLGFLIYTVTTIDAMLQQTPDDAYRTEQINKETRTTFDQETIDRIRLLQSSDQANADLGDRSRFSPFVEVD